MSLAIFAAAADPVSLPSPTGPLKTGRMSFHWTDQGRDELETKAPGDKRELMVHLFYPADPKSEAPGAVYVPDADAMLGPWKEAQIARIKDIRVSSKENAAPVSGYEEFPVIVFEPGGGMKGLTYHAFCEDLASHGWAVAAIDPPYNAMAVRTPDGRVLGKIKAQERGWPQPKNSDEAARYYRERVAHWARDVSFVIDKLTELNREKGPLAGRLDLDRGVGVVGHSRGGQAAGTVRIIDKRVRGGVNLDGAAGEYPIQPIKGSDSLGSQPFLWIQKSLPSPPSEEQLKRVMKTRADYDAKVKEILTSWRKGLKSVSGGALWVTIARPGVEHIDFSDEPFWDGVTTPKSRLEKVKTIEQTRVWLRAFFEGAILGKWSDLKKLVGDPGPETTVEEFGKMWP